MPTNSLTDARCRAAKPAERAIKLFDGGGLHLWISPSGAKVWRLAYRVAGRAQTMSIGPYPGVSLAVAREKRESVKAALRAGDDPMSERRAARSGMMFSEAVGMYWAGRNDVSPGYRDNALRGLEMHLTGIWSKPIASVSRDDLLVDLRRMDASGLFSYVRKVRRWSGQVFDWAVENGYTAVNPAALIKPEKAFGSKQVEHFPALDLPEIPAFMARLGCESELQSVLACRLLALTWVRTNELRMMLWSEIDADLWRIPAGKMKRRKDHLVPLSRQALEIVEKMRSRSAGSKYVFPADHRLDRPMSENAVLYLLSRIGYKGRMSGHGWRTVASTWANEAGHNRDAIERQLAHSPDDDVRAIYNRAEYLPERRAMLQSWADWLCSWDVDPGREKR